MKKITVEITCVTDDYDDINDDLFVEDAAWGYPIEGRGFEWKIISSEVVK
jgi:hypothetical protein